METDNVSVTFRCDLSIAEWVTAFAKENDLTASQVIRKALREFLDSHKNDGV